MGGESRIQFIKTTFSASLSASLPPPFKPRGSIYFFTIYLPFSPIRQLFLLIAWSPRKHFESYRIDVVCDHPGDHCSPLSLIDTMFFLTRESLIFLKYLAIPSSMLSIGNMLFLPNSWIALLSQSSFSYVPSFGFLRLFSIRDWEIDIVRVESGTWSTRKKVHKKNGNHQE